MFVTCKMDDPENSFARFYNFDKNCWVYDLEEATVLGSPYNNKGQRFLVTKTIAPGPETTILDTVTNESFTIPHICECIDSIRYRIEHNLIQYRSKK
jgi:hypothetical protein